MRYGFTLAILALIPAFEAAALVAEPTRLSLWKRGETIAGEEFVAATEEIVDYIATLRRPTEAMKTIRYGCLAKARLIRPSLRNTGTTSSQGYVEVRAVYQLKECAEIVAP